MKYFIITLTMLTAVEGFAQTSNLSIEQAIAQALKNNSGIKAAALEADAQKQLQQTAFDLPKTEISLLYGQYNSYANDNNITISQSIPFSAFGAQSSLNRARASSGEIQKTMHENDIVYQVRQVYFQLAFASAYAKLLLRQDSIFEGFLKSASLRFETGETNQLEQTTAEVQRNETKNQLNQNAAAIAKLKMQLTILVNSGPLPDISMNEFYALPFENLTDTAGYKQNPSLAFVRQKVEVAKREQKLQQVKFAPDVLLGFFSQTLVGVTANDFAPAATRNDRFTGFQIGLSLPIWFVPHLARNKSAGLNKKAMESRYEYYKTTLEVQLLQGIQQLMTNKKSLDYYTTSALPNSERILKQAQIAFKEGEIGYAEYLLGIRNALSIQERYLYTLNDYNQSVIHVEYLTGNK
jgi:cobalt-zinc-cadmium resistance protein CzcA